MLRKITIFIFYGVMLFAGCKSSDTRTLGEEDIYINRIVFAKYDSLPYSGVLERREEGSIIMVINFSNGFPVGPWRGYYHYPDEVEMHGEFLDKKLLSQESLDFIGTDSISISYEKNGYYPSSFSLTLNVLTQDENFISPNTPPKLELYSNIVLQVMEDLQVSHKVDYFELNYVNAIYLPTKDYSVRFKIINNSIDSSWIVQNGNILK